MSQSSMDKGALARSVQAQFRAFIVAHLAPLHERLNQQSYRNLLDLAEGLVRMEGGPHALWTSHSATELYGGDHEPAGVKRLARLLAHRGGVRTLSIPPCIRTAKHTLQRWMARS
jgi:hypothetical protein